MSMTVDLVVWQGRAHGVMAWQSIGYHSHKLWHFCCCIIMVMMFSCMWLDCRIAWPTVTAAAASTSGLLNITVLAGLHCIVA